MPRKIKKLRRDEMSEDTEIMDGGQSDSESEKQKIPIEENNGSDDEEDSLIETKSEEELEDNCFYGFADDNDDDDDDIDDFNDDGNDDNDDDDKSKSEYVSTEDRITKPVMTKYERVRLIGDRAKQLSGGAKPLIKDVEHLAPEEIAELELTHKLMPIVIIRPLPNGKKEKWYINELQLNED